MTQMILFNHFYFEIQVENMFAIGGFSNDRKLVPFFQTIFSFQFSCAYLSSLSIRFSRRYV